MNTMLPACWALHQNKLGILNIIVQSKDDIKWFGYVEINNLIRYDIVYFMTL